MYNFQADQRKFNSHCILDKKLSEVKHKQSLQTPNAPGTKSYVKEMSVSILLLNTGDQCTFYILNFFLFIFIAFENLKSSAETQLQLLF